MTVENVTLTKALTVIKNLTKEIEGFTVASSDLICVCIGEAKRSVDGRTLTEVESKIQSTFDRSDALTKRFAAFKKAVKKANSETTIELYGQTLSINDAITERNLLKMKAANLKMLKLARAEASALYNKMTESLEQKITVQVNSAGGQTAGITSTDLISLQEFARKQQTQLFQPHIVDPCKIETRIQALEKEVSELETELDERLSVVNATTIIEIEY